VTPPRPALTVDKIAAGYGSGLVISGISLEIPAGEIFGVIGPNGSGKTTFIKALAGLIQPSAGEIWLGPSNITRLAASKRVRLGVSYVPQEFNVFSNMTIRENLKLAGEASSRDSYARRERESKIYEMFPETSRRANTRAGVLSGGERQMLAFACAMMSGPKVLLLDEPSAGLSPKLTAQIIDKVLEINAAGVTVFMVEQNVKEALRIAARVAVLVSGSLRLIAKPAEFHSKYDLHEVFLG